jgi:hypothetical protein
VLTGPIPLFACSAAEAKQSQAPIAAGQSGPSARTSQLNQRETLPEQTTFLRPFLLTHVDGVQPAGTYIIENKDKTHDNPPFIAYRPLFRLDHVFYQTATNFGAHSYQFKALNFSLDNLANNERIAFNRP